MTLKHKIKAFIDKDELSARETAVLASELGHSRIYFLKGGLKQFQADILGFKMPDKILNRQEVDKYRFRAKASQVIPVLIKENKLKMGPPAKKQTKRVIGGC